MPVRYDQDTKAKAIRLVREHAGDYPSEYAAITAVARRLGMTPETLRKWIRRAAVDEGAGSRGELGGRKGDPRAQAQGQRAGADDRDPVGGGGFLRAGARPAAPLICAFIDAHRDRFGVVPICRALTGHGVAIAPRTYWARRSRPPSRRALSDAALTEILAGIYEPDENGRRPPECLYGSVKMWEHLNRQGITVAKCTVERLMRAHGWRGVTRGRAVRTTIPDPGHSRAPDLVKRHFKAERPGQLHVADFTYVPLDGGGFGYTAFVIDAFAGLIAGWECSLSKETAFVERAIRQAAALAGPAGTPDRRAGHPPLRRGLAVHLGPVRPDPAAGRADAVGRHRRGCPGQRAGGNDHRPVQDRVHPGRLAVPRRPDPVAGGPGGDHQRLGALVQHRPADAPARPQAPGRS